jgi:hypothetical protein
VAALLARPEEQAAANLNSKGQPQPQRLVDQRPFRVQQQRLSRMQAPCFLLLHHLATRH